MSRKAKQRKRTRLRMCLYYVEYIIFRAFGCALQSLSTRRAVWLAESAAWFVHSVLPRKVTRYQVAKDNIKQSFGTTYTDAQIDKMIFQMWVHLFRMIAEMFQLRRKLHLQNVPDVITYRNKPEVLKALESDRPVIMIGGHFGNWEIGLSALGKFGYPMGLVFRDLDNPYLQQWFREFRQSTGHSAISKDGGTQVMCDTLASGGTLALLGDQHAGNSGIQVDFFGRPAWTYKSIALLAMQYEAIICVGYSRRLRDDFINSKWVRYEFGCEAIIDPLEIDAADPIREITQQYTTALERAVTRSPEQYFWVHRRWKEAPPRRMTRPASRKLRAAG